MPWAPIDKVYGKAYKQKSPRPPIPPITPPIPPRPITPPIPPIPPIPEIGTSGVIGDHIDYKDKVKRMDEKYQSLEKTMGTLKLLRESHNSIVEQLAVITQGREPIRENSEPIRANSESPTNIIIPTEKVPLKKKARKGVESSKFARLSRGESSVIRGRKLPTKTKGSKSIKISAAKFDTEDNRSENSIRSIPSSVRSSPWGSPRGEIETRKIFNPITFEKTSAFKKTTYTKK